MSILAPPSLWVASPPWPGKVKAAAFLPTDITGLKLWLKADGTLWQDSGRTTPATADTDPVGAWDDASGNANNITQATAGKRPLLKTSLGSNSKPTVRCDGIDDALASGAFTLNQPTHIFVVLKQVAWVSGGTIFDSTTANNMRGYQHEFSPGLSLYAQGASQGPRNDGLATGVWGLVEFLFNGNTNSTTVVNAGTPTTLTGPGTANGGSFKLAEFGSGGSNGQIDVSEVTIYDSAISGTNLTNLRSYFNTKYVLY